jgi:hypothetical protein
MRLPAVVAAFSLRIGEETILLYSMDGRNLQLSEWFAGMYRSAARIVAGELERTFSYRKN